MNRSKKIIAYATLLMAGALQTLSAGTQKYDVTIQPIYVETVDDKNFEDILATHDVVVADFYADWCSPCRQFLPVFENVAKEMSGQATFSKVYADRSRKTLQKYQVSSIPTLIIFKNGQEVRRRLGGCNAETLKAFINSAA